MGEKGTDLVRAAQQQKRDLPLATSRRRTGLMSSAHNSPTNDAPRVPAEPGQLPVLWLSAHRHLRGPGHVTPCESFSYCWSISTTWSPLIPLHAHVRGDSCFLVLPIRR